MCERSRRTRGVGRKYKRCVARGQFRKVVVLSCGIFCYGGAETRGRCFAPFGFLFQSRVSVGRELSVFCAVGFSLQQSRGLHIKFFLLCFTDSKTKHNVLCSRSSMVRYRAVWHGSRTSRRVAWLISVKGCSDSVVGPALYWCCAVVVARSSGERPKLGAIR